MLKVCMLVTNGVTPDPRVMKEALTLSESGYDVTVIGTRTKENPTRFEEVSRLKIIRVFRIAFRKKGRILPMLKALFKALLINIEMFQAALRVKADVYHAHDLDTLLVAVMAGKLKGSTIIYDSHELYSEHRDDFPLLIKKGMQLFEGLLIRKVDIVITVNESIAAELKKRYNINKPDVLHNFTRFKKIDQSQCALQRDLMGIDSDRIVVLYHGGYQTGRGLEDLIESAQYVDDNVLIVLRGYGPIEDDLRLSVRQLGLGAKVKFVPPVAMTRLVEEAVFADIGIVSYRPTCLNNYYSLPNKLFEYMMAGLAIVSRDLPEIKKLNDDIRFGALFNEDSPQEIARAVNTLARNKELLALCKQRSLQWSENAGNWETEQKKLKAIYSRCSGEKLSK